MTLTVLTDDDVRGLLHSLDRDDILRLQQSLADALHYYSSADPEEDNNHCAAGYQPERTHMKGKDGGTTLFMPGASNEGYGFKVVTLANASSSAASNQVSLDSTASSVSSLSISSPSSISRTSSDAPAGSITDARTSSTAVSSVTTSPSGALTLFDRSGTPRAFINASEITAFRTALASTMLFSRRQNVHDVVVFGAGKQAYWHSRLALILRGSEVHHLNVINRSFENGVSLMQALFKTPWPVSIPHPKTEIITPSHSEYARHLKKLVRSASVIFLTTPSLKPLFPAEILTNTEGRKKGRYLAAIGSYKPNMCEVHPDVIRQAVAPSHHHHHHRHAKQGGAIIVDNMDACLKEAGELIQAGIGGREVVELGELVMLRRDAEKRSKERRESANSESSDGLHFGNKGKKGNTPADEDGGLKEWLTRGNVVYKSVGMALMDCVVGFELVRIAESKGIGTSFDSF